MMDSSEVQILVNMNAELIAVNANLQRIMELLMENTQAVRNADHSQRLFR